MAKKAKRKSTKKKQPKLKKSNEDYFVSNFLRQPGKTRSGIRYSRITNSKASAKLIFGSLLSLTSLSNKPTKLETAKDQCSCKQCKDNRSKTVTSNHSGLSLMLKSEGNSNSLPNLAKSMPSAVLPKHRQSADSKYCDCYECTGLIDVKDVPSQQKGMLQQSMGAISCEDNNNYGLSGDQQYISKNLLTRNSSDMKMHSVTKLKQPTSNHQKRQKKPKESSTKVQRLKHPLEKCKPRRYKKKVKMVQTNMKQSHKGKTRKGKPTKSLLKLVLKKKSSIRQKNGKVSPQKPKEQQACTCCQRFQNMIRQIGKAHNSQVSLNKRRSKSAGNIANQYLQCTKSGCSETPFASAGYNHMAKTKNIKRSQSVKKMELNESRNVTPVLTRSIQHLKQTAISKKSQHKKKQKNYTRVKKKLGAKQLQLKPQKVGNIKSTKRQTVKWVLLTDKLIKALKDKAKQTAQQNKAKQNKERGIKEQMKQDIAPTPSWGYGSKSSHKRESSSNKYLRSSLSTTLQVVNSTRQQNSGTNDIPRTPFPSSKMPTYIAMVKTAIRDLTPYRMTGKEAISKYIQIRYHIQNDVLLRYILKWMVDMKITKLKNGNYYFSGKRLIKKHTVAVLSKSQKKRKKKKRRKAKKKRKSSKKKSKRKKGKGKKKKRKCTCSQQKNATKNRVKLRSHYIRKHGKIYKQDEYV